MCLVLFIVVTTTAVVSGFRPSFALLQPRTAHRKQQNARDYHPRKRPATLLTSKSTKPPSSLETKEPDQDENIEEQHDSNSWLVRLRKKLPLINNSENANNGTTSSDREINSSLSPTTDKKDSNKNKNNNDNDKVVRVVHHLGDLRRAVLHDKIALRDLGLSPNFTATNTTASTEAFNATTATLDQLRHHPVLQLLAERHRTNSTPGNRAKNDTAHLALAIEGGGMRGAVSAGMAGAIASLGFTNAFDSVYGSSAGSIVGAYMVSRQMCIDVYTEVLPAAKGRFASRGRVVGNLGIGVVNDLVQRLLAKAEQEEDIEDAGETSTTTKLTSLYNLGSFIDSSNTNLSIASSILGSSSKEGNINGDNDDDKEAESSAIVSVTKSWLAYLTSRLPTGAIAESMPAIVSSIKQYLTLAPGMNISFVLDGVMSEQHGLRPFDMQSFRRNDAQQPLYAVASTVRNGRMETVAFNSADGDYFDRYIPLSKTNMTANATMVMGKRKWLIQATKRVVLRVVKLPWVVLKFIPRFLLQFRDSFPAIGGEKKANNSNHAKEDSKRKPKPKRITADQSPLFRRRLQDTLLRRKRTSLASPGTIVKNIINKNNKKDNEGILVEASSCPNNSGKKGFFACIESSMLVPGAAGKPVKLLRSKHRTATGDRSSDTSSKEDDQKVNICFDAFCYEPIPYRSAVQNGATHVLALRSRPDGCFIETVPAVYEKLVAPVFFRLHGLPQVVHFFESGGSQYRYLEDVLTLDEGLSVGCNIGNKSQGVAIPPTDILFGTQNDEEIVVDMDAWKRAHLLPVVLPAGTPELPSLTQDKDEVLMAVRNGFAAAFDLLAPFAGLDFDPATVDSRKIAELMFPRRDDEDMYILETPVNVKGEYIVNNIYNNIDVDGDRIARRRFVDWIQRKRQTRQKQRRTVLRNPFRAVAVEVERELPGTKQYAKEDSLDWLEAEALLALLPGFKGGRLSHLSGGLRSDEVARSARRKGDSFAIEQ